MNKAITESERGFRRCLAKTAAALIDVPRSVAGKIAAETDAHAIEQILRKAFAPAISSLDDLDRQIEAYKTLKRRDND